MPEFVKRSVLSPPGTSDMEGTAVCPCSTKKSMNVWRISLPVIFLVIRTPIGSVAKLYQVMNSKKIKIPNLLRLGTGRSKFRLTLTQVHRAVPGIGLRTEPKQRRLEL